MVGRILRALFYHYIKQKEKQTLKRPDNFSFTMFSPNPLTTEGQGTTIATSSTGTSEKIIMDKIVIDPILEVRDWSIERIGQLVKKDEKESNLNAMALIKEFEEWIDTEEITYTVIQNSLKEEGWTEEQEIDIVDPWT
jgi:hypothetical protein